MPDERLTSDEWLELYRYLLAQLGERAFRDVGAEIDTAATAPLFEESTPDEHVRISRTVRSEVGRATMRSRTPAEMFGAALDVLRVRLTELPAVADGINRHLGTDVPQIEFRLDTPTPPDPIPLARLSVSPIDGVAISEALIRLGAHADRLKRGR